MWRTPPEETPALGPFLFRFTVLADTHINPTDDESPSPWLTNRHANARSRAVVEEINRYRPAFTVHLGDIVHPVPSQASYAEAARQARDVLSGLEAPLHLVPGNHDMGDKFVRWAPAVVVNEPFLATYEAHFGADFHAFEHGGCRFLVLNAQVLNSGLEREREQWEWLEAQLREHPGVRTFLFSHYPPYVADPDEIEHYDNMGEPARSRLLALTSEHGVAALFAGHVHNFFYDRQGETDLYVLPAVSAVRHDYSELFATPPRDSDHGRDDNAKLGFFVIDVHERGHVAHFVRSYGAVPDRPAERSFRHAGVHSRQGHPGSVGVDMRHMWAKSVEIPYQGVVDEFYRKKARNDYTLAALWEMGVRALRVPIGDLLDAESRRRMALLTDLGHEFLVFSFGIPDLDSLAEVGRHRRLIHALEIIVPSQDIESSLTGIERLQRETGVAIYLSQLRSSAEAAAEGARYTHFISHGFGPANENFLHGLASRPETLGSLAGVVFRADAAAGVAERVEMAARWGRAAGKRSLVHVTLADENPASASTDEVATANRAAEAVFAEHVHRDACSVFLDTFADMDRGYFPRQGLVDRLYNPRLAGNVVAVLHRELTRLGSLDAHLERTAAGTTLVAGTTDMRVELRLAHSAGSGRGPRDSSRDSRVVDLASGEVVATDGQSPLTGPWLAIAPRLPAGASQDRSYLAE